MKVRPSRSAPIDISSVIDVEHMDESFGSSMRERTRYSPRRARHCPGNGARSAAPTRAGSPPARRTGTPRRRRLLLREGARRVGARLSGSRRPGSSFSSSGPPASKQPANGGLVQNVAPLDVLPGAGDACLSVRVGEQLERGLDRLEVLGCEQNHSSAAVLGDLHTLVRCSDRLGDLREARVHLR